MAFALVHSIVRLLLEILGPAVRRTPGSARDPGPPPSALQMPREPEPESARREAVLALAAGRDENLAVLSGPTPAHLERSSRHLECDMVALHVVPNTWAAHDLQHMVQAEEAPMQAHIPGTGPFRLRFADHEVGEILVVSWLREWRPAVS